jgi:hypothetical protein
VVSSEWRYGLDRDRGMPGDRHERNIGTSPLTTDGLAFIIIIIRRNFGSSGEGRYADTHRICLARCSLLLKTILHSPKPVH